MLTLSKVKFEFLTVGKWLGIIFGIIISIVILFNVFMFIKNIFVPSSASRPTLAFGRLTPISFPNGIKKDFSYTVDTISGALPSLPTQSKIYKMSEGEPDILAVERTSQRAKSLGFENKPQQLSDVLYRWNTDKPLPRNLLINIHSSEMSLSSSFINNETVISATNLPSEEEATSISKSFLNTLALFPEDIDEALTKAKLFRIQNGAISPATSFSTTQLVTVYFYQKNKDDISFVYPVGGLSTMSLTVASGETNGMVVDARFFYQKVLDESATYPLISANEALEKLKKGEGYVASNDGNDLSISIKKVYLAYFVEGKEQDYLMPVIVFEGKDNFFAYVSAVKDEWVGN